MTEKRYITLEEVEIEVNRLSYSPALKGVSLIYGVPRGGIAPAMMVAAKVGGHITSSPHLADIIIDDIYDSGATATRYKDFQKPFYALFDKRKIEWKDKWLVMPWEATETDDRSATDIVTRLLQYIGENPTREGLQETPARFLKAWEEWAIGYKQDPMAILKTFEDGAKNVDEMVIVHNIPVVSKCEHHLADIIGTAHVGYIPSGKIVGLSKLPRLVDCFSRRLQVQERLTNQIADAIQTGLDPLGAAVVIRAAHGCMATRGVKIHGSVTTTSAMRGVLLTKPEARAEFFSLCQAAEAER